MSEYLHEKGGRMPKQIPLPGFAPAPERGDRLFFAVLPDAKTVARIEQLTWRLRSEYQLQGNPADAGRLHVSLQVLGDYYGVPQALVALASQAASTVVLPPFAVSFDRVLSFSGKSRTPGKQALVLCAGDGGAGLLVLYRALAVAMQELGLLRTITSSFTPHVTLLYDQRSVAERTIEPVTWMIREFALVHSRIRHKRPYELLGRWVLHD
jgi:RNA 2',3'-cyclic 3'-phosphodiesterase